MNNFHDCEILLCAAEKTVAQLEKEKASLESKLEACRNDRKEWEELRLLVVEAANQVQMDVANMISSIVTSALQTVGFDYEFKVNFVLRRGQTEADLLFVRNGEELDPLECSGGGAIDIAAFALRIALWNLKKDTNIFILDEPFKFLSMDMQEAAGIMLHKLAENFGLQIIMVSHNEAITGDNTITLG